MTDGIERVVTRIEDKELDQLRLEAARDRLTRIGLGPIATQFVRYHPRPKADESPRALEASAAGTVIQCEDVEAMDDGTLGIILPAARALYERHHPGSGEG